MEVINGGECTGHELAFATLSSTERILIKQFSAQQHLPASASILRQHLVASAT
ncbi:hypothetical protein IFR05_016440, partial [Cadophora sp. M221]